MPALLRRILLAPLPRLLWTVVLAFLAGRLLRLIAPSVARASNITLTGSVRNAVMTVLIFALALWLFERKRPRDAGLGASGAFADTGRGFLIGAALLTTITGVLALTGSYEIVGWATLPEGTTRAALLGRMVLLFLAVGIFEEVAVPITDVRYVASQPWPFPSSLMLGFSARAEVTDRLRPDQVEMAEVGWFTREEVQRAADRVDSEAPIDASFAPSNGEFSGVRTFTEQVKHQAAANYQLAAGTLGEEPPDGTDHETAPDSVKTKAQVIEYLKGSFTSLHRAAAALNENNMDDPIPCKGNRTRLLMLIDAVVHSSNHYGQMVEYLRMNNIVPPESR